MFTFNSPEHAGDIDLLNYLQWPDDYDFVETRAINLPVVKKNAHYVEYVEVEKTDVPVSVTSALDEAELDNELDPAGLRKAFRFAVWSSVIMVRLTRNDTGCVFDQRFHLLFCRR